MNSNKTDAEYLPHVRNGMRFVCFYAIISKKREAAGAGGVQGGKGEIFVQKIFTRYISYVVAVALLAILALNWGLQGRNARKQMVQNSALKLGQISQTIDNNEVELRNLKESLSEDYLTRAYAFAYIIEQNPSVLDSQQELERIAELLNVDELHVIDENGILFAGSIPLYFGMDFHTTDQTKEFLSILDDPDSYLVQEIRPNGYEQKVFQYIGVARQDQKGIVQVGMAPTRMLDAQKRNQLDYIFSRVPVDAGSVLFAIDKESGEVLAHSDQDMAGSSMEDLGLTPEVMAGCSDGGFIRQGGEKMFCVIREKDGLILGAGESEAELYEERNIQTILTFFYLVLVYLVAILVINRLLKHQIVDGVHTIMDDLKGITDGNLDTVVKVDSNPEFRQLSQGINKMVQGILDATVKISKVIDTLDLPIGVFEFNQDSEKVMATERIRLVLDWTEEEMSQACRDRNIFQKMLGDTLKAACDKRENEFKIRENPEKWVRIFTTTENGGTFGIISDVTGEMQEKKRLEHERDYDSLTGLCNLDTFRKEVEHILEERDTGECAMIMLDLDSFKGINDRFGHDWGDEYLRACAGFLSEFNGGRGIAARRSGDEFCLFLHHYKTRQEIANDMEEFYSRLQQNPVLFPDKSRKALEISSGLAWYGGGLNEFQTLLKAADYALYDAKNSGKGLMRQYSLN